MLIVSLGILWLGHELFNWLGWCTRYVFFFGGGGVGGGVGLILAPISTMALLDDKTARTDVSQASRWVARICIGIGIGIGIGMWLMH